MGQLKFILARIILTEFVNSFIKLLQYTEIISLENQIKYRENACFDAIANVFDGQY